MRKCAGEKADLPRWPAGQIQQTDKWPRATNAKLHPFLYPPLLPPLPYLESSIKQQTPLPHHCSSHPHTLLLCLLPVCKPHLIFLSLFLFSALISLSRSSTSFPSPYAHTYLSHCSHYSFLQPPSSVPQSALLFPCHLACLSGVNIKTEIINHARLQWGNPFNIYSIQQHLWLTKINTGISITLNVTFRWRQKCLKTSGTGH